MPRRDVRLGDDSPQLEQLEHRETPALIGAFDPSFGTGGQTTVADVAFLGTALQADGKIVAVGSEGANFLVARFNPDGSLDTTFNSSGTETIGFGAEAIANAVAIQTNGAIVVAGSAGSNAAVARLTSNGSLDTTFNSTGTKTISFGGTSDTVRAVAIQSDGQIVLAGSNGSDVVVARLNAADGSLDTTFDSTGMQTVTFGGAMNFASAVAIQSNGQIVVAGGNGADFAIARLNSDGSLDTTFNGGTKTVSISGGGVDSATSVAIQADGKIVVAGETPSSFAVIRLNPADGSLDTTFNGTGEQTVSFGGTDFLASVCIQPDEKIVLIGATTQGGNLAIARLTTAGVLDTSFNGTGEVATSSGGTETASAGLLTPEGRIVAVGFQGSNGFVARFIGTVELSNVLAVGGSPNGSVQVYTANEAAGQFTTPGTTISPFSGLGVDVRTAVGDINGDGIPDIVMVTGPGTPIRVTVISGGDDSTVLVPPFDPFGGNFTGGGFVAVGDFTNSGRDEIVVSPDQGGGPRVTIFELESTGLTQVANFFGINDPSFRGGARVAAGDINGDGVADLAVAAGFEGGPRVAIYNGKTLLSGSPTELVSDFFAFPDVLRNGVYLAIGDVNGDGYGDLIFGAGPGGGPEVLTISGKMLITQGAVAALADPISNFFVGGTESRGGVRVATADVDGDNLADVVVASGSGQSSDVRMYLGKNYGGAEPTTYQDINPFGATLADGVFVG